MKGNPFAGGMAGLKKVAIIPKENTQDNAVVEERRQETVALASKTANLHADGFAVASRSELEEAERAFANAAKELARLKRIPEYEKNRYFDTLAGFRANEKATPGKYRITIVDTNNLSPKENELQVYYDPGDRELFYKDGNNTQVSMKIEVIDSTLSNKFTSLDNLTIDDKRAILQLLYDNAFINGDRLKEMALRAGQAKTAVRAQTASQISTINKDSAAQDIAGNWSVGIFAEKKVVDTIAHQNSLNSLDQMPKLKQFIENLATLENADQLPKLTNSTFSLKQIMLSNESVAEGYLAVKRDIEEVRSSVSSLLNQSKIDEIKDEVTEGIRKYGLFSEASRTLSIVPERLSSAEKRTYEDAIPNKQTKLVDDNYWKNKATELSSDKYQKLISDTFGDVTSSFKEHLGKYGSYESARAVLTLKDKFTSSDLTRPIQAANATLPCLKNISAGVL